jgi:hypothetical protein
MQIPHVRIAYFTAHCMWWLIDWLWGTRFTYLLVGYVRHMADVYWGPSGRRYHRTVSHLAWANSHRPPEDKACWASLSRRKTDMCSVSGEDHPCLGLLPGRSIKQSCPLTCSHGLLGTYWASPEYVLKESQSYLSAQCFAVARLLSCFCATFIFSALQKVSGLIWLFQPYFISK